MTSPESTPRVSTCSLSTAPAESSLFSDMSDFPEVLQRPFTQAEAKCHAKLKTKIHSRRANLQPQEIQSLLQDVRYIRFAPKAGIAGITRKLGQNPVILSLCGFCPYIDRDIFICVLRYAFDPRLVHASEVNNDQWEAILVLNPRKYSPQLTFHGRDQFVDYIQKFCDLFKHSICVSELPSWTDPATITAIQRIQRGSRVYGNWENAGNNELRLEFELSQARKKVNQMNQMNEEVRRESNLDLTADNMIDIYYELQHTLQDNDELAQINSHINAREATVLRNFDRYLMGIDAMLNQDATQIEHLNISTNHSTNQLPNTSVNSSIDLQQFNDMARSLQQRNHSTRQLVALVTSMRGFIRDSMAQNSQNAVSVQAHSIRS